MKRSTTIALLALSLAGIVTAMTACRSEHGSQHGSAQAREPDEADEARAGAEHEQDEEDTQEESITMSQAPEAVRAAFAKMPPMGDVKKVERITDDDTVAYEITTEMNGKKASVTMTERGEVMEIEKTAGELPKAVTNEIAEEMKGAKIVSSEMVQLTFYEVIVERDGKQHEVKISANGHIQGRAGHEEED
jgi:uncharacterized membrane protein YkoI